MGNIAEMVAADKRREELQPGTLVAVFSGGFGQRIRKSTVSRVTKTQAIVDGVRYSKRNGQQVGYQGLHVPWIEPWAPEYDQKLIDQNEKQKLANARSKLINIRWLEVKDETVLAALAEMKKLGVIE